jgi:hypothetical protein
MLRQFVIKRPLSSATIALAAMVIVFEIVQICRGSLYVGRLNFIDGTTLVMIGVLMFWGVIAMRKRTDFQAVAFVLVNALSFVFAYEALFKWSFFLPPLGPPMPPAEMRDLAIQSGIALTVLTGVADGHFTFKKATLPLIGLFIAVWAFWMLVGFPQLNGHVTFRPIIRGELTHGMVYLINRGTKALLFAAYLTLFPALTSSRGIGPYEDIATLRGRN